MNLYFYKGKYPNFWLINSIGWIVYYLIDTFLLSGSFVFNKLSLFVENSLLLVIGFLITCGLRYVYKRYPYRTKSLMSVLIYVLITSIIGSILWYVIIVLSLFVFRPDEVKVIKQVITFQYTAWRLSGIIPTITTWSLLYFGVKFWFEWSSEKERAEKADLLAQSAQLQMLRYQVNPHFLFNSFSSLRALIRTDKEKAEEMVTKLSEFYRYSLATKNFKEVPLIEEIEAISHYFDIEKIRFGSKIEFNVSIDPLAEEYPIPSFLIHPLIENAIKYGMKSSAMPLKINIKADVEHGKLKICLANSGKWLPSEKENVLHGTGTGLTNIRSRLEYSHPNTHKFEIIEEDEMVKVKIELMRELK
jgi:hypothetical protein